MTLAGDKERSGAPSIRRELRASTAPLHARVDAYFADLLQQNDGYARFLTITAAAVLPLEQALGEANVSAILPDWDQRSRSAALRSDLAALCLPAPPWQSAPHLDDDAEKFGVLYVLEGSRLGARVLVQQLQKAPTPPPAQAMRYLSHGLGQPLWQTFLKRLEACSAVRRGPEKAISAASAAFAMFLPAVASPALATARA